MLVKTVLDDDKIRVKHYLEEFTFHERRDLLNTDSELQTQVAYHESSRGKYPVYINEFWTARQRQGNSLHEIAYRACFKSQLPKFFIELLTKQFDTVYDPFSGRGTTAIETALLGRNLIANDINPLSKILTQPRLNVASHDEIAKRLAEISIDYESKADMDLSMFYHPKTESEIVSIKRFLEKRRKSGKEDNIDGWIRMISTNRLTGHSSGFFSVYTLPPNQAVSQASQEKINSKRNQSPEYRDTKKLILHKYASLMADIDYDLEECLRGISKNARFFSNDARYTKNIIDNTVDLTVTSPPFLDVVQYAGDNWLRCWFNGIDTNEIEEKITVSKTIEEWCRVMKDVLKELHRITRPGGWIAFEVGEVRNGSIKLDEHIVKLGVEEGLECEGIVINKQEFTKTSNIWGIKNNVVGTNTNRIVLFHKGA